MASSDNKLRFGGADARRLIRGARTAALATLLDDGTPYASLVKTASDHAGQPVILVSRLAWHTRNLEADGRASLLFSSGSADGDPLEAPRVTAIGRLSPCANSQGAEPLWAERFLACHPDATAYVNISDFSFWRMAIERCRAIAGFGRIVTLEADAVVLSYGAVEAFLEFAREALDHMNGHHQEALQLYATQLLMLPPADWRATALDCDGIDLSDGERSRRLAFAQPVSTAAELRATLKALADQARRA